MSWVKHFRLNLELGISVPGYSNLFTGSVWNTLDLYMKYTAEVVPLRIYIVWFTSV